MTKRHVATGRRMKKIKNPRIDQKKAESRGLALKFKDLISPEASLASGDGSLARILKNEKFCLKGRWASLGMRTFSTWSKVEAGCSGNRPSSGNDLDCAGGG